MKPPLSSQEQAKAKRQARDAFATSALNDLLPLLQKCPGHWFRSAETAIILDLDYLSACHTAYLSFQQTALFSGFTLSDFSSSYHELRERSPLFHDLATAPWTNPFAAAFALKEWVDTTTYYLKMMRDCIDIPVEVPWGRERDLWAELGSEGRRACEEWFERYNRCLPGKGTGEWKPPMRGELADEQARAWGKATTEDVEVKLGLRRSVERDQRRESVREKTREPVFRVRFQRGSKVDEETTTASESARSSTQHLSSKRTEGSSKDDTPTLFSTPEQQPYKRYYRPKEPVKLSPTKPATSPETPKPSPINRTLSFISSKVNVPAKKPKKTVEEQMLPKARELALLHWDDLHEKEKLFLVMMEKKFPEKMDAIKAELNLVDMVPKEVEEVRRKRSSLQHPAKSQGEQPKTGSLRKREMATPVLGGWEEDDEGEKTPVAKQRKTFGSMKEDEVLIGRRLGPSGALVMTTLGDSPSNNDEEDGEMTPVPKKRQSTATVASDWPLRRPLSRSELLQTPTFDERPTFGAFPGPTNAGTQTPIPQKYSYSSITPSTPSFGEEERAIWGDGEITPVSKKMPVPVRSSKEKEPASPGVKRSNSLSLGRMIKKFSENRRSSTSPSPRGSAN